MSQSYEEILDGLPTLRSPPGERHERICRRLHERLAPALAACPAAQLLACRTRIQINSATAICPDVAVITAASGKLWLAAEVISPADHHTDTVIKKAIYEDLRLARLWMIDPRYDNVEVYHATPFGLALQSILAGSELLTEALWPGFQISIRELFAP
ncbi:Uma2 family endonuclease [Limisphaera sp. VF-2]|jgi:Uma2 family endonuclease|uniref:Uma2 family endonuclease n=1 Tax=Limisphaera sp. VF-2 TaxID=3400418 RepID=UPI001769773B|nr:Uma2 family endonuclease [Limisphaera sp.]